MPSLVCNLLTTGLAIWAINYVLARAERRRRHQRAKSRRLLASHQTFYPCLVCLGHGHAILRQANRSSFPELGPYVLAHEPEYTRDIGRVRRLVDVYGRFLSVSQLHAVESVASSLDGIVIGTRLKLPHLTAEFQQMGIFSCLQSIGKDSRDLIQMLRIPNSDPLIDRYFSDLAELNRKWGYDALLERVRAGVADEISESDPELGRRIRELLKRAQNRRS